MKGRIEGGPECCPKKDPTGQAALICLAAPLRNAVLPPVSADVMAASALMASVIRRPFLRHVLIPSIVDTMSNNSMAGQDSTGVCQKSQLLRWGGERLGSIDFEIARKQKRLSAETRSGDV